MTYEGTKYAGFEYDEELTRQIAREHDAAEKVRQVFRELLADVGGIVWSWGDGEGGSLVRTLGDVAEELGFPVPQNRWSLPPRGPSWIEVVERDAYRCQECGDWHDLTIDHIHPRSKGGSNDLDNLRVLCRSCNSKKGAR